MYLCDVLIICFSIKKIKLDTSNLEPVINNGLGNCYLNWSPKGTITGSKHRRNGGLRKKWIYDYGSQTHRDMLLIMLNLMQEPELNYIINAP